jgi:hypothetical protein
MFLNFIVIAIIIIALGIVYQKYNEKQSLIMPSDEYGEIKKYLLNVSTLANNKKPVMWIYIPYEYNSRDWSSFGSRSSYNLNQPYLYLTVRSIIQQCEESFFICLIDDSSFAKLIPNWNIDMTLISDPILSNVRQLAIAKLIYIYGGINVPISFLCTKNLIDLYEKGTNGDKMFVCENVNNNISATNTRFYPDARFMGAKKNNICVKQLIDYMQLIMSNDYTVNAEFNGGFNVWVNDKIMNKQIKLIPGTDVGTKTIDEDAVIVDNLLGQNYIHFYGKMYGIWIPSEQILKRTNYEWFARMSPEQIFQSNCIIAKYIVLATAPDAKMGFDVLENNTEKKPDWVSFWKVPATNGTLNVWGPMPLGLGDNLRGVETTGNLN